jgi:hypothetical protein
MGYSIEDLLVGNGKATSGNHGRSLVLNNNRQKNQLTQYAQVDKSFKVFSNFLLFLSAYSVIQ